MNYKDIWIIIGCLIMASCISCSNTSNKVKNIGNQAYDLLPQNGLDQGFPGIILAIQKGDEKTVDAIVFECYEILILKAREANIGTIEIEKFLHSESLKWLRFSNKMIFGK